MRKLYALCRGRPSRPSSCRWHCRTQWPCPGGVRRRRAADRRWLTRDPLSGQFWMPACSSGREERLDDCQEGRGFLDHRPLPAARQHCSRESARRSSSWADDFRQGTTRSSRPCTIKTGLSIAASSAPDSARSSTQRCRGSGNFACQESGGSAAEAELIRREHPAVRTQRRDHWPPVRRGGDAGT